MSIQMIHKAFYSVKHSPVPNGVKIFSKTFKLDDIPAASVYKTITNIDLYHKYIPYCTNSKITAVSPTTKMPTEGCLNVEFQKYSIFFTCDVQCKENKLLKECIATVKEEDSSSKPLFDYLSTKWTVEDLNGNLIEKDNDKLVAKAFKGIDVSLIKEAKVMQEKNPGSEINLELAFKFNSYLFQTISVVFGDAVLELIIKAFKNKMIDMHKHPGH